MTTPQLQRIGLLEYRNIKLYNELLQTQQIDTVLQQRNDYATYTIGNTAIIYVATDNLRATYYTHELLHIFLRTKKVFLGSSIISYLESKPKLNRIVSDDFREQVPNMLDHVKMLPLFLELGYDRKEFIQDYDTDKFTWLDLGYILAIFRKSWFWKKRYTATGVDQYIGRYFAARTCPDPSGDYTSQLNRLKKLDAELFEILETFFTAWENYDYDNPDSYERSYHRFSLPFVDSLDAWAGKRKII